MQDGLYQSGNVLRRLHGKGAKVRSCRVFERGCARPCIGQGDVIVSGGLRLLWTWAVRDRSLSNLIGTKLSSFQGAHQAEAVRDNFCT